MEYTGVMANELHIIKNRRDEVLTEIAGYKAEIERLESELPELDVAERVLARLTGEPRSEVSAVKPSVDEALVGAKPEGIPTVPEMIVTLLKEAQASGSRGMSAKDLLDGIAKRWWPDAKSDTVAPTAWRMRKRGDLDKDGVHYSIPKTNTGSEAEASEPSEVPVSRPERTAQYLLR